MRVAIAGLVLFALLVGGARAEAEPVTVDLSIRGGVLPAESRLIRASEGDDVTLRWTADAPVALHLHGYDLEQNVVPGAPATMRFTARATGRFPIETHGHGADAGRTLGYLEVHPR